MELLSTSDKGFLTYVDDPFGRFNDVHSIGLDPMVNSRSGCAFHLRRLLHGQDADIFEALHAAQVELLLPSSDYKHLALFDCDLSGPGSLCPHSKPCP